MTPFFGGMLADRLLGRRRAVVFGGLLMAAGHLLMTVAEPHGLLTARWPCSSAGNGFFKPNISTIVGDALPQGSEQARRRLHASSTWASTSAPPCRPSLCGYIGETYGWHYGFGLATIGMLSGVAVFVAPTRLTQILIALTAVVSGGRRWPSSAPTTRSRPASTRSSPCRSLAAAVVSWVALGRGGLPAEAGLPPYPRALEAPRVARAHARERHLRGDADRRCPSSPSGLGREPVAHRRGADPARFVRGRERRCSEAGAR